MTRRKTARDEPGRRRQHFHLPHLDRRPVPRWQQLLLLGIVLAIGVFIALRDPMALRPTIDMLTRGHRFRAPGEALVRDRPAAEWILERRRQGLSALLQAAERGPLVPRGKDRVLFLVDQSLVAALLGTQFPREYVIEDDYRVWITGARMVFEDGLALVRLDGRASLVGAEEDVFADVAVFGDLEVLRQQPVPGVLRTRINLIAVDARRTEVGGRRSRNADALVEKFGRSRLSAFAALASGLEIPVRHEHAIELPPVDEGPIRIAGDTMPLKLALADVKAFRGRLWITMAASFEGAPPVTAEALHPLPLAPASTREPEKERIARLEREVEDLRARFKAAADRDPLVAKAASAEGHVTAAVSPELFEDVVQRIAARYLDHVAVQLDGLDVKKEGEIHRDTLFGSIKAGEWTASIAFPRIRGVLKAGVPHVSLPGDNRVRVELPVLLERGGGTATVSFQWDSRALVNVICRDFEVTQEVAGRVEAKAYPVSGQFALAAGPDELTARPSFDDRFRIHPRLDPASWDAIRRRLDEQDEVARCGLGLDPDKTLAQLVALVDKGFMVKLPAKLFRPVSLPTRLTPTVNVQGRDVEVELSQSRLEAGPEGVWYGVWVKAGLPRAGAAGPQR